MLARSAPVSTGAFAFARPSTAKAALATALVMLPSSALMMLSSTFVSSVTLDEVGMWHLRHQRHECLVSNVAAAQDATSAIDRARPTTARPYIGKTLHTQIAQ